VVDNSLHACLTNLLSGPALPPRCTQQLTHLSFSAAASDRPSLARDKRRRIAYIFLLAVRFVAERTKNAHPRPQRDPGLGGNAHYLTCCCRLRIVQKIETE
jgi:hypothetical protein